MELRSRVSFRWRTTAPPGRRGRLRRGVWGRTNTRAVRGGSAGFPEPSSQPSLSLGARGGSNGPLRSRVEDRHPRGVPVLQRGASLRPDARVAGTADVTTRGRARRAPDVRHLCRKKLAAGRPESPTCVMHRASPDATIHCWREEAAHVVFEPPPLERAGVAGDSRFAGGCPAAGPGSGGPPSGVGSGARPPRTLRSVARVELDAAGLRPLVGGRARYGEKKKASAAMT